MTSKSADKKAPRNAYQALFEFVYSPKTGRVERGQVFPLEGLLNDERLTRLNYVVPVEAGTILYECGECGKLFVSEQTRAAHGDLWHGCECEGCGWVPRRDAGDRQLMLAHHRERCPDIRTMREQRRAKHIEEITEKKLSEASQG